MATVQLWNGFGKYETNEKGEQGITLFYGGVPFWLPFEQVSYIPDFTFREVDHDKSAAEGDQEGILTYRTFVIRGERIAEELLETQIPVKNSEKGIIRIYPHQRKFTGKTREILSGYSESGEVLTTEVRELEPAKEEIRDAARKAEEYKRQVIQDYFQSKRERMAGGHGQLHAKGAVRVFMDELNVADIDDVENHQKGGLDADLIRLIIEETRKAGELNGQALYEALETVRKMGKAQVTTTPAKKNAGVAVYAKAYDAALAEGKTPEEAKALAIEARDGVGV